MSLSRYLHAKRTVDDRALNARVWSAFVEALSRANREGDGLSILEVAGGIGSMVPRILELIRASELHSVDYTLVDIDEELITDARQRIPAWGDALGFEVDIGAQSVVLQRPEGSVNVILVHGDAFEVLLDVEAAAFDAVITQAWLDLVNVKTALERIFRVLIDEGIFYAPLHVDGGTRFLPAVDARLDRQIVEHYHRSMDGRQTRHGLAGGSRTGSRLLTTVLQMGAHVEAAGASSWIVRPTPDGDYPDDEAYFLRRILDFVETEARGADDVPQHLVDEWAARRRGQLDRGTLTYVCHHLDVLARKAAQS